MIEPLHGVTRDTAGSLPEGEHRPATPPAAPPLPSRRATPPAGPDLGDHRYAALAAWSASAGTITMALSRRGTGSRTP
ncbi:hypothetical protein [Actinoplanes philippinensis]|uniref:hypothetical protein n=1 Tax=Actinoplanes philippinensis TaxID=35752 RepID=UPI0033CC2BA2